VADVTTKEIFEKDKSVFDGFDYNDWCRYYAALDAEKPVEQCGLDLTDNEKICYSNALEDLQRERRESPHIPICYGAPNYSEVE